MLDEGMRERLGKLAREDVSGVDDESLARIVADVRKVGPVRVRRARWMRASTRVGLVAAAAAIALMVRAPVSMDAKRLADKDMRACVDREALDRSDGRLSFGVAGHATFDGQVTFAGVDPCEIVLQLESGRVRVHADDLGGGTLTVLAGTTQVTVWGTIFSVIRDADDVRVEVEEGRVQVVSPGWRRMLRAEQTVGPHGAVRSRTHRALDVDTAALANLEPREHLSVDELVVRAERERQGGEFELASRSYRRAGALSGPTAEAAWLALARMERSRGRTSVALRALQTHTRRFPGGALGAEVAGFGFRVARDAGRLQDAERFARRLRDDYPDAPQAAGARAWLASH